jgi:hypothetical protein
MGMSKNITLHSTAEIFTNGSRLSFLSFTILRRTQGELL